jgi:hypothetical protein
VVASDPVDIQWAGPQGPGPLFSLAIKEVSVTLKLQVDPFFDDEEEGFVPSRQPGVPAYARVYKDPSNERFRAGDSILNIAGAGPRGTYGVLIPHAKEGNSGVPNGIDPNNLGDIVINIDPQLPGQNCTLQLKDLSADLMEQVLEEGRELSPDTSTLPRRRKQASTMFRLAALHIEEGTAPPGQPLAAKQPQRRAGRAVKARQQIAQAQQPTPKAAPTGPASPVLQQTSQAFGPPPLQKGKVKGFLKQFAQPPAQPLMDAPVQENYDQVPEKQPGPMQPIKQAVVEVPTVQVAFELQGFGQHDAVYHDVTLSDDGQTMTLVYDNNFTSGSKWFPRKPEADDESLQEFALQIIGRPEVYLVTHSGVQYAYGNLEFCTLNIHKVGAFGEE